MKQVFWFFCAIVACITVFTSCHSNKVDNQEVSDSQIANVQNDDANVPENRSSDNETTNEVGLDTIFKSHYSDSWWQCDEYEEIVIQMREKGYYIDPAYLPKDFDGHLKLSILDDADEFETSLSNEIFSVHTAYWSINDEEIHKSARMQFAPKEEIQFKDNLKELFDEAIAFRPEFRSSFFKVKKEVTRVNIRIRLYSTDVHINPKGFELDIKSNHGGTNMHSEDCDRLFVVTAPNKDRDAKIIFAYLYDAE